MKQMKTNRVISPDDIDAIIWSTDQRVWSDDIASLIWAED
jgi:hypothetical protein